MLWAAYPFHWSAVINARHGAATMDTLVSIGVGAAYLWSTVQLLRLGWAHAQHEVYFEVATVVTTFILAGHFLEANAKRQATAALRALADLGAKEVTVLRDGIEQAIPLDHSRRRRVRRPPGREDRHRRRRRRRRVGHRRVDADRRVRTRDG